MPEAWENLRIGDRIRFVRLPTEGEQPGYFVCSCTRRLYQRLIARRRSVRVYAVDRGGLPWIRCRFRLRKGGWEHHYLAVNDDSWVRVQPRAGGRGQSAKAPSNDAKA